MPNEDGIAFDPVIVDTTEVSGYNNRLAILTGTKVVVPCQAMWETTGGLRKIYIESVKNYLYGLPNSSIVMTIRFFQIVARNKFRIIEANSQATPNVEDLINWTAKHLGESIDAHGFKILRNYVHTEKMIEDADALEGIRHISIIANKLFPYPQMILNRHCTRCRAVHHYEINNSIYFIGNVLKLTCPNTNLLVSTEKINL